MDIECPYCGGDGDEPDGDGEPCAFCDGTGHIDEDELDLE